MNVLQYTKDLDDNSAPNGTYTYHLTENNCVLRAIGAINAGINPEQSFSLSTPNFVAPGLFGEDMFDEGGTRLP